MMGMRERRRAAQEHLAQNRDRANELLAQFERMQPGRYTHAVLQLMVTCVECGAVVIDTERHDDWHDTRSRPVDKA